MYSVASVSVAPNSVRSANVWALVNHMTGICKVEVSERWPIQEADVEVAEPLSPSVLRISSWVQRFPFPDGAESVD